MFPPELPISIRLKRNQLWVIGLVFLVSLAITFGAYIFVQKIVNENLAQRFQEESSVLSSFIESTLANYISAVNAERALFLASEEGMQQKEWTSCVKELGLLTNYPGISSAVYLKRVPYAEQDIYSESENDEYFPVTYIESQTKGGVATMEFDVASEKLRRVVLEKARDTGEPTATPVAPSVSTHEPSFSVYAPIYKNGAPIDTITERREALIGFVGVSFHINELFQEMLKDPSFVKDIEVEIYDAPSIEEVSDSNLIFHSDKDKTGLRRSGHGVLFRSSTISVGGRTWTIFFGGLPSYMPSSIESRLPEGFLGVGLLFDLLILWLLYSYAASRERAISLADSLTKDMQQSKNELREYIDQMSTFNFKMDVQGNFLLFNRLALSALDMTEDQFLKTNFLEGPWWSYDIEVQENVKKNFQEAVEFKKAVVFDVCAQIKDGVILYLNFSIVPVLDDHGEIRHIVAEGRDVSELKKIEAALRENEQSLKLAEQTAKLGSWVLNHKLKTLKWSDEIYRIFDINPDNFGATYESFLDMIHPDDRTLVDKTYTDSVKNHTAYSVDHRILMKNGSIKYVQENGQTTYDDSGKPLQSIGTILDITERKKNEIELKASKEEIQLEQAKYAAILASMGEGVIVANKDGELTYFNDAAEKMLGVGLVSGGQDQWSSAYGLIDPVTLGSVPVEKLPLVRALAGEIVEKSEILVQNPILKKPVHVSVNGQPVKTQDGKILGAVVTFRDISKEKEIDKAKTEFVSLASHQLKTPIGAIQWELDMLISGDYGVVSDAQKEVLNNVYGLNKRMDDLVNAFLNMSRIEMGVFIIEPKPTDFIKLCEEVIQEMESRIIKKGHTLTRDFDAHLPHVSADVKLLRVIFQNFISNAIKYTPDNGEIKVLLEANDNEITFSVENNGESIPEEDQSKIFSKLFRASNARKQDPDGNGLGLYVVKKIVESSGGRIWFTSKKGENTVFSCSFPLSGMVAKSGTKQIL